MPAAGTAAPRCPRPRALADRSRTGQRAVPGVTAASSAASPAGASLR